MNCARKDGILGAPCVCLRCTEANIEKNKLEVEELLEIFEERMSRNTIDIGEALFKAAQPDHHWRNYFKKTRADIEKMKRIVMIQENLMKNIFMASK